ncbi:expressed protein, partial [Phakopsora pachyrhizi]
MVLIISSLLSSRHSAQRGNPLLSLVLLSQTIDCVVSSACYFDSVTGRTVCEGLPYGARLAIAAAITVVGALALAGLSFWVRKRFYSQSGPPPVSVGYYGPPQTNYPPTSAYAQQNLYTAPGPTYDPAS